MFTGIIETIGKVVDIKERGTNKTYFISASILPELKIDQSVAHNGICLTVDGLQELSYSVTAIQETINKTHISDWTIGTEVNLERCLKSDGRLDGHFVQGHVDTVAICTTISERNGSWEFVFKFEPSEPEYTTVKKGSITVNGTSLTVVQSEKGLFSVEIIPYTYENTIFRNIKIGDKVNLEFDILGKYIIRFLESRN